MLHIFQDLHIQSLRHSLALLISSVNVVA